MKIIKPKEQESNEKSEKKITKGRICFFSVKICLILFCAFTLSRTLAFKKEVSARSLTSSEIVVLQETLNSKYPERNQLVKALPYAINNPKLDIGAESAILIDTANGCVLYEKNADEIIPPASMTKLFAMYVVDEEVSAGRLKYEDYIELPPESWACNMPPHSSLMFLGEGQKVTLEELLLGLSICSGNDAAYALAYTVCGNMEAFVERMNKAASDLGLVNTHFVESSGYSELNTTTAREMAAFCRVYINQHEDSLYRFHSVLDFTYPKERNLAPGDVLKSQDFSQGFPRHITMPITQKNTNPLLGKLQGCDGLKTGYIDESGYNLSLTAHRLGTRFLSVTMKGPGNNSAEGQAGRVHDGTELMEWAFYTFADYTAPGIKSYFVRAFGCNEKSVNLVPAVENQTVTIPFSSGESVQDSLKNVKVIVNLPENIKGGVICGQEYGTVKIILGDYTIQTIPLVADRSLPKANFVVQMSDWLISSVLALKN